MAWLFFRENAPFYAFSIPPPLLFHGRTYGFKNRQRRRSQRGFVPLASTYKWYQNRRPIIEFSGRRTNWGREQMSWKKEGEALSTLETRRETCIQKSQERKSLSISSISFMQFFRFSVFRLSCHSCRAPENELCKALSSEKLTPSRSKKQTSPISIFPAPPPPLLRLLCLKGGGGVSGATSFFGISFPPTLAPRLWWKFFFSKGSLLSVQEILFLPSLLLP